MDLARKGYTVIAAANPLRSVKGDAKYVAELVSNVPDPVVLVGHSYGGKVVSITVYGRANVKVLVSTAGYAPDNPESGGSLAAQYPTGTLNETLAPGVALLDGNSDLYIEQPRYWTQFAADIAEADTMTMAVTQRPVTAAALAGPVAAQSW